MAASWRHRREVGHVGLDVLDFHMISLRDVPRVGGKNASSGELFNSLGSLGVGVVDGFATTAMAYRRLLEVEDLGGKLRALMTDLDPNDVEELERRGHAARAAILETPLPPELRDAILSAHDRLCARLGRAPEFAVRSSASRSASAVRRPRTIPSLPPGWWSRASPPSRSTRTRR